MTSSLRASGSVLSGGAVEFADKALYRVDQRRFCTAGPGTICGQMPLRSNGAGPGVGGSSCAPWLVIHRRYFGRVNFAHPARRHARLLNDAAGRQHDCGPVPAGDRSDANLSISGAVAALIASGSSPRRAVLAPTAGYAPDKLARPDDLCLRHRSSMGTASNRLIFVRDPVDASPMADRRCQVICGRPTGWLARDSFAPDGHTTHRQMPVKALTSRVSAAMTEYALCHLLDRLR